VRDDIYIYVIRWLKVKSSTTEPICYKAQWLIYCTNCITTNSSAFCPPTGRCTYVMSTNFVTNSNYLTNTINGLVFTILTAFIAMWELNFIYNSGDFHPQNS